ncbi:MAG: AAA domain protein [Hyperionvirus sp.]|uniref:AAA domain protein n=1 Tax=Hyperionvirus sp. TaxID=2487770 RepID=A0A3G5A827_9VIRU|nr:MAG: AAA domain protein [Hyperionvirus sp.]
MIIHVSGPQTSGKTTIGATLSKKYGDSISVTDLDNLWSDYLIQYETNKIPYQMFIKQYITNNKDKPLIFVGLDANLCLGPREIGPSDDSIYYNLHTDYAFYIYNPIEKTL